MSESNNLVKKLENLGLSKNQAGIYVLLLMQGNLRVSDIVRSLNMPRSSVYETLKGLYEHGLAEEVVENSFKMVKAYPISSLKNKLDEKMQTLQQQSLEVDQLEKALRVLPSMKAESPITIRYYKGRAGARQLFWNTLRAKDSIYVQSEWGRGRYVGITFYKNFVAESRKRDIDERVLTNSTTRVLESIRQHNSTPLSRTKIECVRCFSEAKLPFKGETFMYNDIYAHINLKNNEISGFEIESNLFTSMQRKAFEALWKTATSLETELGNKHEH